jgi:hypothetical protein
MDFVMERTSLDSLRVRQAEFAKRFNLSLEQYLKIMRACTADEAVTVFELLKAKRHSSHYRARMELQVRRWIDNGVSSKPLTVEQFKLLKPQWPVHWRFPN